MAANQYFNSFQPQASHHDQLPTYSDDGFPQHPQTASTKPLPEGPPHSPTLSAYDSHNGPYGRRHSQASFTDETAFMGGRNHPNDQYGEDIPLKPNVQQSQDPHWMNQNTAYNSDMPMDPDMSQRKRRGRPAKRGFFKGKIPWVTYLLTIIDIGVFVGELIYSAKLTGSPIEIHPTFNPMVGPSPYVQINMGARFVPCMKNVPGIQNASIPLPWSCPNTTTSDSNAASNQCTLSELCGFSGVPNPKANGSIDDRPEPNQWFRFIIPMFMHAGLVHIGFNMLMQMSMGADMERTIGWWRYALVYFASGIFGFVLGGNYAAQIISSTGASGALFGILALFLLDLLYTWRERRSPWVELVFLILEIAISFVLGLLPGLDNFSHIGGFIMGLAMGLCMMRSPNYIRERIGLERMPYVEMSGGAGPPRPENRSNSKVEDNDEFKYNKPLSFFKGRKPLWWAWWLVRVGSLVAVIIGFILLITNFYKYPKSNCSWCYHLSCLPVKNWCSIGNLNLTTS
ncbi:uncharacterized protein TRUGW13939_04976 [Talaromyces rugulosus]|uniref:Rhomboid-type serine protease n=1 Tax=Talaromyces rugulosus TaxID=121627 RepID=A0A7H8QVK8_TALRU|nr:uncharacterized protein TRUGW13939_04976 [Talaromyces rugulosus]QKX57856.1 hypothetical protein TRUGW13939_04976 [Talaromyces rugulosus]